MSLFNDRIQDGLLFRFVAENNTPEILSLSKLTRQKHMLLLSILNHNTLVFLRKTADYIGLTLLVPSMIVYVFVSANAGMNILGFDFEYLNEHTNMLFITFLIIGFIGSRLLDMARTIEKALRQTTSKAYLEA